MDGNSVATMDVRELRADEQEAVGGGFLHIILGAELFGIGFLGGVIACNVVHDRPWNEF